MPNISGLIIIAEQGFPLKITVDTNTGQINTGSMSRTGKYTQILRIEGDLAVYAGMKSFYSIKK